MNKGLWNFVSRSALLCATLLLTFTLLAGIASAHATHTLRPQDHNLGGSYMYAGGQFDFANGGNDYLLSPDQKTELTFQTDGNLVLYDLGNNHTALWASKTDGKGADVAKMQSDGNFVLYTHGCAIWATGTSNNNSTGFSIAALEVMGTAEGWFQTHGGVSIFNAAGTDMAFTPQLGGPVGRGCS